MISVLERAQPGGGDGHRVSVPVVTDVYLMGTGSRRCTGVEWEPQMRISSTAGERREV